MYIRRDRSAHGFVQVSVANILFSRGQLEVVKDVRQFGDRKRHLYSFKIVAGCNVVSGSVVHLPALTPPTYDKT